MVLADIVHLEFLLAGWNRVRELTAYANLGRGLQADGHPKLPMHG